MTKKKYTLVRGDDWQGLYIDGILQTEDHEIQLDELMAILGVPMEFVWAKDAWLQDRGDLPTRLVDVERDGN